MATQVQRRRGTTAQHAAFSGQLAELTVDTDKMTVVVQDGSTLGGHPLAKAADLTADNITITDTGGNFTATDVEGALAELSGTTLTLLEEAITPLQESFVYPEGTPYVDLPVHHLQPVGVSADIHAALAPKGDGSIIFRRSDNYWNYPAGENCVDMQISASYGISGLWNTGMGTSCFTGDDTDSCVVGGLNSGVYNGGGSTGAVALGYQSLASGTGAVALSGGVAFGDRTVAINNSYVYGVNGQLGYGAANYYTVAASCYKSAQSTFTPLAGYTTDATALILTSTGSATPSAAGIDFTGQVSTWDHSHQSNVNVVRRAGVYAVTVRIIGAQVTSTSAATPTGDFIDVEIKATVWRGYNTADNVVILGTPTVTTINRTAGAATWAATLVANQTRRSLEVQVTGEAAKVIRWSAKLDTVEV